MLLQPPAGLAHATEVLLRFALQIEVTIRFPVEACLLLYGLVLFPAQPTDEFIRFDQELPMCMRKCEFSISSLLYLLTLC